ncbi:putative acyl-coenzyme A thioesterase 4-like isoform 5, partial [Scophthalmus maximus]
MERKQCCVKLSVQPSRGLMDEKFIVRVQSVPPGFNLTVHALHHCEDGHSWEAYGHYTADATGTVNVSEDPSLGGTYSGVEPMGLLWSLRPVPGSKTGLRMRKMNVQTPMEVTVSVYQGHMTEGFVDQVPLASVLVERWYIAPGIRRIPVTEGGLTATLFLPPGPGPFPGVLDLWGGGGNLVEYRSALFACHGLASLALDYLTPKITKETGKMVDNEYIETAYRVLQQHPQVLGSSIAMLGLSFGTSVTLKMAVYSEVIKLRCAVCISGSHVQPVDGSLEQIMDFFHKSSSWQAQKQLLLDRLENLENRSRRCNLSTQSYAQIIVRFCYSYFSLVNHMIKNTAYRVLQQHPQVLGSSIAMLGFSLGTSVTLKMAVYSEVIKVRQSVFPTEVDSICGGKKTDVHRV